MSQLVTGTGVTWLVALALEKLHSERRDSDNSNRRLVALEGERAAGSIAPGLVAPAN